MLNFISPRTAVVNSLILASLLTACGPEPPRPKPEPMETGDVHTYSDPAKVKVNHIKLDLTVDFERKVLTGFVDLEFERTRGADPIVLDTRALAIESAEASGDGETFVDAPFELGEPDPILGTPLRIDCPITSGILRIHYSTTAGATALQWLEPRQTAGKRYPFLFTQGEAIHTRSWIPLQDTPSVKTTYSATIRTPKALRALMSASNSPEGALDGDFQFEMPQPVPSYLIALAVGDLAFRTIGARTGVYAEKPIIAKAAAEFEDTEKMLKTAERLFGRYRWGRYDILVLPPSFPFGGMENPRLTFATPTMLAGDKSLVSLIAHELAHSWAGNLVTNATWSDFWLNEGFAVYLERRIVEAIYGSEMAAMESVLGREALDKEMAELPKADQILHVNLDGRDPDDGFTLVPYEKGYLFLKTLEAAYGRERFDQFLRGYFESWAFKSITTREFRQDLQFHLMNGETPVEPVPVDQWLYEPGIPADAWVARSEAFERVEQATRAWLDGVSKTTALPAAHWSTQEWLHFLGLLPTNIGVARLGQLDRAFHLTRTGNSEILCRWLLLAIQNGYQPAYPRVHEFLTSMGRRKFLKPLYEELAKTEEGKRRALAIYKEARPTYHPIAVATVDKILGWNE